MQLVSKLNIYINNLLKNDRSLRCGLNVCKLITQHVVQLSVIAT